MITRGRRVPERQILSLAMTAMVAAWFVADFGAGIASAQTDNTVAFSYAHGRIDESDSVLVFTSTKGGRILAVADRKGDYRVPLEPGQYCVSAYTSNGDPLQLSPQQLKCIDVSARKDVRLDVVTSRALVAAADLSSRTIEAAGEIEAQVLAGKILDASQKPIPGVLVEQLSADGKRVESVVTDANGKFVMKPRTPWVYVLRTSKPGFDSVLFRVRISKFGKRELALTMPVRQ